MLENGKYLSFKVKNPEERGLHQTTIAYDQRKNMIYFMGMIPHMAELILTQEMINGLQEMFNKQKEINTKDIAEIEGLLKN